DALPRDPAPGQIIGGALAYRLEGNAAIRTHERTLQGPHHGGDRRGDFLEHRRAEEVRNQRHDTTRAPAGRVERYLVDVLDQHVVIPARELLLVVPLRVERKGVARSDPVHGDSVEAHVRLAPGPAAAEESHLVAARGDPAEDLVQVNLRPAG